MSSFQEAKAAAMRGSLHDFEALSDLISEDNTLLYQSLPVVYHHLHLDKLPIPAIPTLDAAKFLMPALQSIKLLNGSVSDEQFIDPKVVSSLKNNWTTIWSWCHFFLTAYIYKPVPTIEEKEWRTGVISMIAELLTALSGSSDLTHLLGETIGLIPLVSSVWKLEAGTEDHWPPAASFSMSNVLTCLLGPSDPLRWLNSFLATVGGSSEDIAALCLRRVVDAIQNPTIRTMALRGHLFLMLHTARKRNMYVSYLSINSIAVITGAMRVLTSRTKPFDDTPGAVMCLDICSMYLEECCARDGFHCIIQALDGRLLMSMLKSGHILEGPSTAEEPGLEFSYADLLVVITPYLIYRPILRLVSKTLKSARRMGFHRDMVAVVGRDSTFANAWRALERFADERVRFKTGYDMTYRDGIDAVFCSNRGHRRISRMDEYDHAPMGRCSGCYYAFYCSNECQKDAWETGHQEECHKISKAGFGSVLVLITHPDNHFVNYGISFDLQLHAKEIAVARAGDPGKGASLPITQLDYRRVPLAITMISTKDLEKQRDGITGWELKAKAMGMPRGTVHLILVIIPEGPKLRKLLQLQDGTGNVKHSTTVN